MNRHGIDAFFEVHQKYQGFDPQPNHTVDMGVLFRLVWLKHRRVPLV